MSITRTFAGPFVTPVTGDACRLDWPAARRGRGPALNAVRVDSDPSTSSNHIRV
jgi:hypothetical protein